MRRNTEKICLVLSLLLITTYAITIKPQISEVSASDPFPTSRPVLFTYPDLIEQDVGVEFTVSIKIFNLTNNIWTPDGVHMYPLGNLYGVGMNLSWDPTVLEYVNHLVKIPIEDYADGILYSPSTEWENNLNIDAGWYRMAYSSMSPAPVFNNPGQNNTVFEISFRALKEGSCDLLLTQVQLSGKEPGDRVYHEGYETNTGRGAVFTTPGVPIAKFNVWPADLYAGVNKPVKFNASESYDPDGTITDYIWNFGDGDTGSGQIVNHTYTSTGLKKATLKVRDNTAVESRPVSKTLTIVEKRDIAVRSIEMQQLIKYGKMAEINVTVSNLGGLGGAKESFSVSTYYNSTPTNGWVLIGSQSVTNLTTDSRLTFSWNTNDTVQPPGGESYFYHIVANATHVPHEANATDNSMATDLAEVTAEDIHDVSATIISVAFEAGARNFESPFILGENVTARFEIKSLGTTDETYNITLRVIARNGTELLTPEVWDNEFLEYNNAKSYRFSTEDLPATYCNITLKVDIQLVDRNTEDNFDSLEVRVVKPPTIDIDYPESIYMDESVTFNAAQTVHQDPEGEITSYTWDVQAGSAVWGSVLEGVSVSYIFNSTGTTTVRLRIVDSFGLTFDSSVQDIRPKANVYKQELTFTVQARSGGGGSQFPIDPIYIVIGIVVVVIVAVVAYRLLRKPKLPE